MVMKLQTLPEWYLAKIKAKIEVNYKVTKTGCWEWQGGRAYFGYGKITLKNVQAGVQITTSVHRVYYQLVKGFVDESLVMSHECDNPPCINPDHLTPTSQWENNARGSGVTAKNLRKTQCDNGHAFTQENTGVHQNGWRYCRICSRLSTNRSLQLRTRRNHIKGLNSKGLPLPDNWKRKYGLTQL